MCSRQLAVYSQPAMQYTVQVIVNHMTGELNVIVIVILHKCTVYCFTFAGNKTKYFGLRQFELRAKLRDCKETA